MASIDEKAAPEPVKIQFDPKKFAAAKEVLARVSAASDRTTEGLDGAAIRVLSTPATHATRVDRRFPNTNQINNCWCVTCVTRRRLFARSRVARRFLRVCPAAELAALRRWALAHAESSACMRDDRVTCGSIDSHGGR